jgi:hypothetical protein
MRYSESKTASKKKKGPNINQIPTGVERRSKEPPTPLRSGCKKLGGLLWLAGAITDLGLSIPISAIDPFLLTVRLRYRDLKAITYSRPRWRQ